MPTYKKLAEKTMVHSNNRVQFGNKNRMRMISMK